MVSAFCDINLSIIHLKEDVLEYEHEAWSIEGSNKY